MADRIRVLHVDDDPNFAEMTASFLERDHEGLTVETATGAAEGRRLLADSEFDCVVSDYEMPGTNGIELLESVREDHPDLPFILFTGKGSEAVASDAISAGVTDYIQKGSGTELFELLVNRIGNAVGQYRTAQELDRQSELFTKTQRLADVGAWEWDPQASEGFYTEQVYEIYGIDERLEKEPAADILKFYHPEDRGTVEEVFERAVETGDPYDIEVRVIDADGVEKWVRTRGDPKFEGDTCVRISGTIRDITDRKERERELERQVDRLEEFTGVVSHDLRNPLNVAQGRLELFKDECGDDLEAVTGALDRMEAIIDDTLTLARQGRTVADPEPVPVADVVKRCWGVVESGGAELRLLDEFTVQGDRSRLAQLFENLFRNSVEHAPGNPQSGGSEAVRARSATSRRPHFGSPAERGPEPVTVRVGELDVMHTSTRTSTDETFGFFVEDDGPGIPPERREAVFEAGESSHDDGTGFGLPIIKRVAEAHGWEVDLTGSFDGGARFEFTNVR